VKKRHVIISILSIFMMSCSNKGKEVNVHPGPKDNIKSNKVASKNIGGEFTLASLPGKWMLLLPEGGYSRNEYIEIVVKNNEYSLSGICQGKELRGKVESDGEKISFISSDKTKYTIASVESIDPIRNGAVSLDLPNDVEDILLGIFQKSNLLNKLENE